MRVKLFETIVSVSVRGDGGNFKDLENQINSFLDQNPDITVVDIKLTGSAAPVGDVVTNYGISALLLYNEPHLPPAI
jgi:hypothetical protein